MKENQIENMKDLTLVFKEMYIKKQLHSVFSYQIDKYWKIMNAIAHEEMRK